MPQQGLSVGRDTTLVIQTPTGSLPIPKLTAFRKKQDTSQERVKLINGVSQHLRFFDGWSGSFSINRAGPEIEGYFDQLETDYYSGINEQPCQIYETVSEPSGAISKWRYDGVVLSLDDGGEAAGDASVKLSLTFMASRRIRIL
ncbi:hypothetical protein [Cupriavidus taiwanensis]|uniref:hypothetical protein n=1 Tax=Cupriavidus taiwanensis TaxID=164546 RepID=UPI000E1049DF|nr:hypothetical protein [Cupriavidus taiwanensis]SOY56855.1 conserved hypothetical protein [Cupriavidus taiwanensis]SOY90794.1 conserved hypothetical protein [Cupriavidus taiwanensis]SOZ63565.1 conserved hypothetical protein [Cupriavidus taiwanensis]SOZ82605.1 conserved hypothetical protein [Cupriavidus taiwanensis]SOZ84448.1 conserved hypothetical protein [Cupriavidus taiwanensis]